MKSLHVLESFVEIPHWLADYLGISEADSPAKTKRVAAKGKTEEVGETPGGNPFHRRVEVFPLWEVVDERNRVLGSLAIQPGGKARLVLGAEQFEDKLQGL